jgi:uncharacterized protein YehS (DUF1456 family)
MTRNDILIRLRYLLNYSDAEMVTVFAAAEQETTEEQVKNWLTAEGNPQHEPIGDRDLSAFLNGLINHKRGKRPGPQPVPDNRLTNNLILTKLKIAFCLKGEDMIRLLALAEFSLSNHELSAFFRKPGHKHFRKANDQILRNFLKGLQVELRP